MKMRMGSGGMSRPKPTARAMAPKTPMTKLPAMGKAPMGGGGYKAVGGTLGGGYKPAMGTGKPKAPPAGMGARYGAANTTAKPPVKEVKNPKAQQAQSAAALADRKNQTKILGQQ